MFSDADLLEMHRRMLVIRGFEERVAALYRDGEVPGFVHLSIGQEASAVGACWPLDPADVITSTHRGHGHCLAKGLDPLGMFAELMAKDAGTNRGRGGSMHIADPTLGIFGANGIVGAGLPIAAGAATAAQLRRDGSVAVAFFGDGAVAHGTFHEAINLAAVWQLPVIFFCENNGYAEFSPASTQHAAPLERARGRLRRRLRRGRRQRRRRDRGRDARGGRGDARRARVRSSSRRRPTAGTVTTKATRSATDRPTRSGSGKRATRCSSARAGSERRASPTTRSTSMQSAVARELDDAVEAARRLPAPAVATLTDFVARAATRTAPSRRRRPPTRRCSARWTRSAPRSKPSSPATSACSSPGSTSRPGGNVFGLTRGLHDRFGDRVRDTPISESAIVGLGVGAAMAGMRPVVELMYLDFLGVCLDQLLNQAAKLPFMTGGAAEMALTVRTQFGAGRSSGSQHSQSLEALLAHIPGLTVVMPSTPADTYGLLRAAIQDPNPVVFIENRLLYGMKGPQPPADHILPIGKSAVVRAGHRHHRRVGVAHGARSGRRGRARSPAKASPSR